jgi:Uncharacterized protein conserved in bacteria (DUF2321)
VLRSTVGLTRLHSGGAILAAVFPPPGYTSAAVCKRGHVDTTDTEYKGPSTKCSICGADVLTNCSACGMRVRGYWANPLVVGGPNAYKPPDFCDECGSAAVGEPTSPSVADREPPRRRRSFGLRQAVPPRRVRSIAGSRPGRRGRPGGSVASDQGTSSFRARLGSADCCDPHDCCAPEEARHLGAADTTRSVSNGSPVPSSLHVVYDELRRSVSQHHGTMPP